MAIELHVSCDLPTCDETEKITKANEENFDFSSTVTALADGGFIFVVDTGWEDSPEDWTCTPDGSMRCPRHRGA